jgi:hypothetical protein
MRMTLVEKDAVRRQDLGLLWNAVYAHLYPEYRYGFTPAMHRALSNEQHDRQWNAVHRRYSHLRDDILPRYHRHNWRAWWQGGSHATQV